MPMKDVRNIAVVGSGIAGLSAAWLLSHRHRVTLFEANEYVGGHTNTVEVDTSIGSVGVDTGFVVFNERNYPNLVTLFDWLNVSSQATDMSFSVSADNGVYEYA
ncbi:MAG: FAD-dependent oxidoreductase, partial [Gammaproteobacteria bacterium]|nr:FAD-dependent oxidoreductase [Gammaproteobacteria bacterium]